jgi:dolichol-phosphate mannosyltransferase
MIMDWALIIPLSNEERSLGTLIHGVTAVLDRTGCGTVYLVVDDSSTDRTPALCREVARSDPRFLVVYEPGITNVVAAYLTGYRKAYENGHAFMIEMDAGSSHDPRQLPDLLHHLREGRSCVYGSRFIPGGSMSGQPFRWLLSRGGSALCRLLLGTNLHDMTSGYQGFDREVVGRFLEYSFLSTGHFYQSELRFLLRRRPSVEVPIHYRATTSSVPIKAILNSVHGLFHYFGLRVLGRAPSL